MGYIINPKIAKISITIPRGKLLEKLNSFSTWAGRDIVWGTFSNDKTQDYLEFKTETNPLYVLTKDIGENSVCINGLQWNKKRGFYSRVGRQALELVEYCASNYSGNMWVTGKEYSTLYYGGVKLSSLTNEYSGFNRYQTNGGYLVDYYKHLNSDLALNNSDYNKLKDNLAGRVDAHKKINPNLAVSFTDGTSICLYDDSGTIRLHLNVLNNGQVTLPTMSGTSFRYKNTYEMCQIIIKELEYWCVKRGYSMVSTTVPSIVLSGRLIRWWSLDDLYA